MRMSQLLPIRAALGREVFFVTAHTFARRPLFQTERVAQFFLDTLFVRRTQAKFRLHEFVVMPDHFHLLLSPLPEVGLARTVQLIQGGFAYRLRKEFQLNLEVWEPDYWDHRIRDAADYERHLGFIWEQPVLAGISAAAEWYPYSSACGNFELDARPEQLKARFMLPA